MMGGWFLSTSIGNKLSGVLASMWDTYDDKSNFFWLNFGLLMAATLLMFILLKRLNAVIGEKGLK
jgi:POT family proton-dependent oligopeptide transporter